MVRRVDLGGSSRSRWRDSTRSDGASRAEGSRLGPVGQSLLGRLFGGNKPAAPPAARSEAPVIAIASGKGGTGKSFLATNVSIALHQLDYRVALVDCDFGLACAHLLMGVKPRAHLRHLLTGEATLSQVEHESPAGPTLLPGVTGVRQMAAMTDLETGRLGTAVGDVAGRFDLVLLDLGAGLTPQGCAFLCAADHVVLVTQPEIAALTDAYAVVKTMGQLRSRPQVSVVVNRVLESGHGEQTFDKLQEVAGRHAQLALHYLGCVGDDPQVTQRRLGQLPILAEDPASPTAAAVRAIARRLAAVAGPFETRQRPPGEAFAQRLDDHCRLV